MRTTEGALERGGCSWTRVEKGPDSGVRGAKRRLGGLLAIDRLLQLAVQDLLHFHPARMDRRGYRRAELLDEDPVPRMRDEVAILFRGDGRGKRVAGRDVERHRVFLAHEEARELERGALLPGATENPKRFGASEGGRRSPALGGTRHQRDLEVEMRRRFGKLSKHPVTRDDEAQPSPTEGFIEHLMA